MRFFYFFTLFFSLLYGIEIDSKTQFKEILSSSLYFKDYNRTTTIDTAATKKFIPYHKNKEKFGYSPNFDIWLKFTLTNSSDHEISKIIEYSHVLTSFVEFYDAKHKKLLKSSGMLNKDQNESLTPFIKVTLKPYESRTFYIKIASRVTSLIPRLNLWNPKTYYAHLKKQEIILGIFFGALGMVLLYNFTIFFMTRKLAFLYYFIAFSGVFIYYLFYQGVLPLFVSNKWLPFLNSYIPFIVLFPVVFLSLFTKEVLDINRNKKLNRIFIIVLIIAISSTFIFYGLGWHSIRNFSYVILFGLLFLLTIYYYNKNSYAKYLFFSWVIFFLTALFMYLENVEIFNLSSIFPYYSEIALLLEAVSFSLILAHYIEKLDRSKKEYEQEIKFKKLMIDELDHRISSLLQSILFKVLQEEKKQEIKLNDLRHNILTVGEINRLLNRTQSYPKVNMQEYLTKLIQKIQKIYKKPNIKISTNIDKQVNLKTKIATSCAKIVHEALTNIYKFAFENNQGEAKVLLNKEGNYYTLTISDNGIGIKNIREGAKGLMLIENMAKYELNGTITINSIGGVQITIRWQDNE